MLRYRQAHNRCRAPRPCTAVVTRCVVWGWPLGGSALSTDLGFTSSEFICNAGIGTSASHQTRTIESQAQTPGLVIARQEVGCLPILAVGSDGHGYVSRGGGIVPNRPA
jgi:hypothetical protein